MRRREFCKLAAAAAAGTAIAATASAEDPTPLSTPTPPANPLPAAEAAQEGVAVGFGQVTQTYAEFCQTPAQDRVFYALEGGKVISERLDEATWKPTGWIQPPDLPIPGGSWDGVPMVSPIPNLAGSGPFQPTWESLLNYEAPDWYRDAKFGIWAHWSPQCVPEAGDWYARNMYIEGRAAIPVPARPLRTPVALRLQGSLPAVDPAQLATRGADRALQESRCAHLRRPRQPSRRPRHLELAPSSLERGQRRSASRCRRNLGQSRARRRPAPRRHRPSGAQLVVVPDRARRRHERAFRRRSLRRHQNPRRRQRTVVGGLRSAAASMRPSILTTRCPTPPS